MSFNTRICFMLAALVLASATLARDPELRRHCEHQCPSQKTADREACIRRCEDYDRRRHGAVEEESNDRSPVERLRDCNERCERREGCQRLCRQEYDRERAAYERREKRRAGGGSSKYQDCRRECQRGRREEKEYCEERCERRHRRHGGGYGEDPYEVEEGRGGWIFF